jgi:hypothetical protein
MTIAPGLLLRPRLLACVLTCGLGLWWIAAYAVLSPRANRAVVAPPLCMRRVPAIEPLGATHYRVSRRAFAQLYRASQTWPSNGGEFRLVPSLHEHRPIGVRIYAVAPRSLAARLGFANGDLIERINAIPMTSPERAIAAYSALQSAPQLRVDLLRGTVHVHLVYDLVD